MGLEINLEKRFFRYVEKSDKCWIWKGLKAKNGYGRFAYGGRKGGMKYAHRISWLIHKGFMPTSDSLVCHRCDVKDCVNPEHLFLGTYLDNNRDSVRKGRNSFGERRYNSKLNADKVKFIRENRFNFTLNQLAIKFGVVKNAISQVANGKTWKHI